MIIKATTIQPDLLNHSKWPNRHLVLVGGMGHVPLAKQMMKEAFPDFVWPNFFIIFLFVLFNLIIVILLLTHTLFIQAIPDNVDPDYAIAKGAALFDAIENDILRIGHSGSSYKKRAASNGQVYCIL